MAKSNTGSSTTRRAASSQKSATIVKATKIDAVPPVVEHEQDDAVVSNVAPVKEFSPHDIVTVKNGFDGKLIYKSKRTGELFVWESFGAEQDMEIQELRNARNSYKDFFINNWFMFDDPDIIKHLGVERYYSNSLTISEIDSLFSRTPAEIRRAINAMPASQRDTIAQRSRYMFRNDKIDSVKVIHALEDSLGISLLDR